MPSPGRIGRLQVPQGPGVRDDGGVYEGAEVSIYYDPMISKFAVHGRNRAEAIDRMRRALAEYHITGLKTTIPFFRVVMNDREFFDGNLDTGFIERFFERIKNSEAQGPQQQDKDMAAIVAALTKSQEHNTSSGRSLRSKLNRWQMSARKSSYQPKNK
jgi:acetyl/propionyl-CoA carboxylase alpha subunit